MWLFMGVWVGVCYWYGFFVFGFIIIYFWLHYYKLCMNYLNEINQKSTSLKNYYLPQIPSPSPYKKKSSSHLSKKESTTI
jgi:hypothetical protein